MIKFQRITYCLLIIISSLVTHDVFSQNLSIEKAIKLEKRLMAIPVGIRPRMQLQIAEIYSRNHIFPEQTIAFSRGLLDQNYDIKNTTLRRMIIRAHSCIAIVYTDYSNYEQATTEYYDSYNLLRPWDPSLLRSTMALNLASSLIRENRYTESERYITEALQVANNAKDTLSLIRAYRTLSDRAFALSLLDTVLIYENKIIQIAKANETLSAAYTNLARAERMSSYLTEAHQSSIHALSYAKKHGDSILIADATIDKALFDGLVSSFDEAILNLGLAERFYLNQSPKNYKKLRNLMRIGAIIYDLKNEHTTALRYMQSYLEFTVKVEEKNETERIKLFKSQLKMVDREKEIEMLLLNKKLKEESSQKIKMRFWFIVIILISIVVISIYIILSQKDKARTQSVIERQNVELTRKRYKDDLRKMELKAIMANIEGQERERERIAKELHDGIGGAIAGIKLELESIAKEDKSNDIYTNLLASVRKTYQEVRSISRNLSIPSFEGVTFDDNIQSLLNDLFVQSNLRIQFTKFPQGIWPIIPSHYQKEIYRVIQEALVNIIKHAKATKVDVQLLLDSDSIRVTIEDNGVGFNEDQIIQGIGLRNMRSRIEVLKGTLVMDSSIGDGTFIELTIPIII